MLDLAGPARGSHLGNGRFLLARLSWMFDLEISLRVPLILHEAPVGSFTLLLMVFCVNSTFKCKFNGMCGIKLRKIDNQRQGWEKNRGKRKLSFSLIHLVVPANKCLGDCHLFEPQNY